MALRNAFDQVATETTLGTRASEVTLSTRASEGTLTSRASEATLALAVAALGRLESGIRQLNKKLTYARTSSDQLRVVVDNTIAGTVTQAFGDSGAIPALNAQGSPNAVDARDMMRLAMRANFIAHRNARWSVT